MPHAAAISLQRLLALQRSLLGARHSVDEVMQRVAGAAQEMTAAAGAVVELRDGDEMVYRAATGSAAGSEGLRLGVASSLSGACVASGETIVCQDSETDPRVDKAAARKVGARSMILIPLVHEQGTLGVLKVLSPEPAAFGDYDVAALELAAGLLAIGLANAMAFEALRESEQRWHRVFEESPVGKIVIGKDLRFQDVNQALCDMLGYTRDELVGRTLADVTHPDDVEEDQRLVRRLFEGEMPGYAMEKRYITRDGRTVWALLDRRVVRATNGDILYALSVVQDVTARKMAEEEARAAQVARPLVRRIMREMLETGRLDPTFLADMGRRLAGEAKGDDVDTLIAAITSLGFGSIEAHADAPDRYTFVGHNLLEQRPGARSTTCDLTLGYLNGVVERVTGAVAVGTETACVSRGDRECRFVVRAKTHE